MIPRWLQRKAFSYFVIYVFNFEEILQWSKPTYGVDAFLRYQCIVRCSTSGFLSLELVLTIKNYNQETPSYLKHREVSKEFGPFTSKVRWITKKNYNQEIPPKFEWSWTQVQTPIFYKAMWCDQRAPPPLGVGTSSLFYASWCWPLGLLSRKN